MNSLRHTVLDLSIRFEVEWVEDIDSSPLSKTLRFRLNADPTGGADATPVADINELPPTQRWAARKVQALHKVFPSWEDDEQKFAIGSALRFTAAWLDTLVLYGLGGTELKPKDIDMTFGFTGDTCLGFLKHLKKMCLWPTQALDGLRVPPILPFKGRARRYLIRWFRTTSSMRKQALALTILQMKKLARIVPLSFADAELDKYFQMVGGTPGQSQEFREEVANTAASILGDWFWDAKPDDVISDFSTAAAIGAPRNKGGAAGWAESQYDTGTEILRFERTDAGFVGTTGSVRFPTRQEVFEMYQTIPLERRVVQIFESFKIRHITLTHPCESPFWASFQRGLRDTLRRHPANASGVIVSTDMIHAFAKQKDSLEALTGDEWVFISDDATAATDNLDPQLSVDAVIDRIPQEYKLLFREAFGAEPGCRPVFYYKSLGMYKEAEQNNCQPMGDRRSFVILQLIHISVKTMFTRRVRDYYRSLQDPKEVRVPFLVNGDDGLILAPKFLVRFYFDFMSRLWIVNETKTRVSSHSMSLNSRAWEYQAGETREVPLVRWNLIYGVDKYGVQMQNPQVWNTVLRSAGDLDPADLWKHFHSRWFPQLKKLTRYGNNYFLPITAGGLGLVPFREVYYTPWQRAAVSDTLRCVGSSRKPRYQTVVKNNLPKPHVIVVKTTAKIGVLGEGTSSTDIPNSHRPWVDEQRSWVVPARIPRRYHPKLTPGEVEDVWKFRVVDYNLGSSDLFLPQLVDI